MSWFDKLIGWSIRDTEFTSIDTEKLTTLELASRNAQRTNELIDQVSILTDEEKTKVSKSDMPSIYKLDDKGNFTGTWDGLHPIQSEAGLQSIVTNLQTDVDVLQVDVNTLQTDVISVQNSFDVHKGNNELETILVKAQGNGIDDTLLVQTAIDNAPEGSTLLFMGSFKTTNVITINKRINIVGNGSNSIIESENLNNHVISVSNTDNIVIQNLVLKHKNPVVRNNGKYALFLSNVSNFLLNMVEVSASSSAGILIYGCHNGVVTKCYVHDTLADGIHITKGSKFVKVFGNHCVNTGDDGIAVVSYIIDGVMCEKIVIQNNTIEDSLSRGIVCVGGQNIDIAFNMIDNSSGSGIWASEDSNNNYSYGVSNIKICHNHILNAGQNNNVGAIKGGTQHGIHSEKNTVGLSIIDNYIVNPTYNGISHSGNFVVIRDNKIDICGQHGIYIFTSTNPICSNNRVANCQQNGIKMYQCDKSLIEANYLYNNNMSNTAGVDNMYINGCTNVICKDTMSVDDRNPIQIERLIEFYNCTNIVASNNQGYAGTAIVKYNTCTNVQQQGITKGTLPVADSAYHGAIYLVVGGVGIADVLKICVKKADDTYAWMTITLA